MKSESILCFNTLPAVFYFRRTLFFVTAKEMKAKRFTKKVVFFIVCAFWYTEKVGAFHYGAMFYGW